MFVVRVLYETDPERKRAEYIIENTPGSRKTKGLTAVMPEDGVRKILEKIDPMRVTITGTTGKISPDKLFDYRTETIKLPPGIDEKMLRYFLRSSKIMKEDRFLRTKCGTAEITELNLSSDKPYINLRYNSSGGGGKIAERLRTAIGIYAQSMES